MSPASRSSSPGTSRQQVALDLAGQRTKTKFNQRMTTNVACWEHLTVRSCSFVGLVQSEFFADDRFPCPKEIDRHSQCHEQDAESCFKKISNDGVRHEEHGRNYENERNPRITHYSVWSRPLRLGPAQYDYPKGGQRVEYPSCEHRVGKELLIAGH